MPSKFPGMDPFLEDQVWPDFHTDFITAIRSTLLPSLRPRYIARIEERVYLQFDPPVSRGPIRPDLTLLEELSGPPRDLSSGTAVMAPPILLPISLGVELREAFLEVRLRETHEVVAVIEVLSPSNKARGTDTRGEYLAKRWAALRSDAHFIEIDLLRGGARMPMEEPLPACDYVTVVSRADNRPMAGVWPISLRDPLPVIPVPLAGDDPDVPLDLQQVFDTVYDRAGYDYSVDYCTRIMPPLSAEDQEWLDGWM